MKKQKGFTLSEVLITLAIIGIVAALTIPSLIVKKEKQGYVIALKKAYTMTNQVLIEMAADNGCIGDLKCTGLFNINTTNQSFGSEFVKYFKILKDCGVQSLQGCFNDNVNIYYDGSSSSTRQYDEFGYYEFITADGISFAVYNYHNNCIPPSDGSVDSMGITGDLSQVCGYILVDVNGPTKKPNSNGRDIFQFWITNGKTPLLYPYGGIDHKANDVSNWWKDPSNGAMRHCISTDKSGWYCAGRIVEESWEMNY